MNLPVRTYAVCITFGLCAVFVISFVSRYQYEQAVADAFFSSALQMVHADETVVIRGKTFRVYEGLVETSEGTQASSIERRNALRIAYAHVLARRTPTLGIAGNDPQLLFDSANQLAEVVRRLASVQKTAQDALAIQSLYPIQFLLSLAGLEKTRLAFVASGTDIDELVYRAALSETLAAGQQDILHFQKAFSAETTGEKKQFRGLGGASSVQTMQSAAHRIEMQFGKLEDEARRLNLCLRGRIELCYPDALVLGRVFTTPPEETPRVSDTSRALIVDVMKLYTDAALKQVPATVFASATPIVLTRSVCLAELPGPFVVILGNTGPLSTPPLWYVSDIFFLQTENSQTEMHQYLAKKHDMRYSRINPTIFYMCPDMGIDLAKAKSVRATAEFAQRHPDIARAHRSRLLSTASAWYESDAYAYMRAALAETPVQKETLSVRTELETITLMWKERAAGLDGVVANIARTGSNDIAMYKSGVPYDVSAQTLFLTQSAFPTLFLADTRSKDMPHAETEKAANSSHFPSALVTYSDIRAIVSRDRIVHDLREFLVFERVTF